VLRHVWWVLGAVLVVGGLAVALTARTPAADVGWFAYTPLDESSWPTSWADGGSDSALFVSRQAVIGWAVAAVGLLALGSGLAYVLGRRAGRRAGEATARA